MCEKCKSKIGSMKKGAFNKGAALKVAKMVGGAAAGFMLGEYVDTLDMAQQNRLVVGGVKVAAGGAIAYFMKDDLATGAGVGLAVSGVKTAVIGGYEKAGKPLPKFLAAAAVTGTEIPMGDTDFFIPVEQINGFDEPMNGLDEPMNGYDDDEDDEMNGYEGGGY